LRLHIYDFQSNLEHEDDNPHHDSHASASSAYGLYKYIYFFVIYSLFFVSSVWFLSCRKNSKILVLCPKISKAFRLFW
jgi:hypothetical protein